MSPKKISSGVVHEVPADLKKALTSDPPALQHGRILHRSHATSGYVGLSQLRKQKLEAAGSSGAVQALRMENDAPVVGPDATTANSKMGNLDIATARDWSLPLPVCASFGNKGKMWGIPQNGSKSACSSKSRVLVHASHRFILRQSLTIRGEKQLNAFGRVFL